MCAHVQFTPDSGPREGGTLVTIEGTNLGKTFADIRDGVTVGGVKCYPVEDQYVPSIRCVFILSLIFKWAQVCLNF